MVKEDFGIGQLVDVVPMENDLIQHEFTGRVKGYHGEYVTVEDGDGDCWDCEPSQLTITT